MERDLGCEFIRKDAEVPFGPQVPDETRTGQADFLKCHFNRLGLRRTVTGIVRIEQSKIFFAGIWYIGYLSLDCGAVAIDSDSPGASSWCGTALTTVVDTAPDPDVLIVLCLLLQASFSCRRAS